MKSAHKPFGLEAEAVACARAADGCKKTALAKNKVATTATTRKDQNVNLTTMQLAPEYSFPSTAEEPGYYHFLMRPNALPSRKKAITGCRGTVLAEEGDQSA